jgi:hypothetical protein
MPCLSDSLTANRRPRLIRNHQTIAQRNHSTGMRSQRRIMRHQHQRRSFHMVQMQQQVKNVRSIRRIEIARRLIRKHNRRLQNKRTSQCHTLLLTAR